MSEFRISNIQYFSINGERHTSFDIDRIGIDKDKSPTGVLILKGWINVVDVISNLTDDDFAEILKLGQRFIFAEEVTQH